MFGRPAVCEAVQKLGGVPVILAAGDSVFASDFGELTGLTTVSTKTAVGALVARLIHPEVVRARLVEATNAALDDLENARPIPVTAPVRIQARWATTTRADILQAIPGMGRVDGYTVDYTAPDMEQAYRMIRLMYKHISW